MITAKEAKKILEEGNARYASCQPAEKDISAAKREDLLNNGQHPFAVVVTCADSRVPAEIIFDQALGDLFVIRVAGNVLDECALGSVEYAVDHLHCQLVVMMGHENCGAVGAALVGGEAPGSIGSIVARIRPSMDKSDPAAADYAEQVCDHNIYTQLQVMQDSPVIKEMLAGGGEVIGAKYFLGSGKVEFFD